MSQTIDRIACCPGGFIGGFSIGVLMTVSPEGLDLEPSDTRTAYAVARALQILRMLLQRMQRPNMP
jgi:hypothetical protein